MGRLRATSSSARVAKHLVGGDFSRFLSGDGDVDVGYIAELGTHLACKAEPQPCDRRTSTTVRSLAPFGLNWNNIRNMVRLWTLGMKV